MVGLAVFLGMNLVYSKEINTESMLDLMIYERMNYIMGVLFPTSARSCALVTCNVKENCILYYVDKELFIGNGIVFPIKMSEGIVALVDLAVPEKK